MSGYQPVTEQISEVQTQDDHQHEQSADPLIEQSPKNPLRAIVVAMLAFAAAAIVTLLLVLASGEGDATLAATRMTLELAYPTTGEPTANLEGQPGAAPAGATIVCRSTSSQLKLGEGEAAADGSFDVALDASAWPRAQLAGDTYRTLNTTVECRAGSGSWVQPLRPPRVAID